MPAVAFTERAARTYGPILNAAEQESRALSTASDIRIQNLLGYVDEAKHRIDDLLADLIEIEATAGLREDGLTAELEAMHARKIVRLADAVRRVTQGRI